MSRLIATRISDEQYSKIMGKCAGLRCSVYDYLKVLVETDLNDTKGAKRVEEQKPQRDERINAELRRIVENWKRQESEEAAKQRTC